MVEILIPPVSLILDSSTALPDYSVFLYTESVTTIFVFHLFIPNNYSPIISNFDYV